MFPRIFFATILSLGIAGAQAVPQRAAIVGGGNSDTGQCTVMVSVDGNAQVDVMGADGMLRNLGGVAPKWRRFECTSAMPPNPPNFQFTAVSGRGHQNLVAQPRSGVSAVVKIEDTEGGAGDYAFRLTWSNGPASQDLGAVGTRDDRGSQRDRASQTDRTYQGNRADQGGFQGHRADQGDRGFPADRADQNDRGQQGRRGDDSESYHQARDSSFRGNGGRAMFFQRIREDLDHATSGAYPFTGDRARLQRTQMELDELQQKLAKGYYDERSLDRTMTFLQAVVQGNRLAPRDRDMLTEDLSRMRDFRIRHDQYGAR
jgi:hypothetical protein